MFSKFSSMSGAPWVRSIFLVLSLLLRPGVGQEPARDSGAADSVRLNLPTEIEVQGLVDYVSERLGVRVLYDDKIANRRITIRAPGEIPADSLLGILKSALRLKGLALVDTGTPGWMKIVESGRLVDFADPLGPQEQLEELFGDLAVTQLFPLKHVSPQKVESLIKPFLTPQGGNTILLEELGVLIVSDYVSVVQRIARLVEQIDRPAIESVIEFLPVSHAPAAQVAEQVQLLLGGAPASSPAEGEATRLRLLISSDTRTNQVLVVGTLQEIEQVKALVRRLDVTVPVRAGVYVPSVLSAERLSRFVMGMLTPEESARSYQATIDSEGNVLIVVTTEEIHKRIEDLIAKLDQRGADAAQSRVKFYPLKYLTATEVLETLRGIEGGVRSSGEAATPRTDGRFRLLENERISGPNRPQLQPMRDLPTPPAVVEPLEGLPLVPSPLRLESDLGHLGVSPMTPLGGAARVTADISSNTLIVIGDPAMQKVYEELIQKLDRPRPQVLIEAKVVVLDTTDNFSFGVEFSAGDRSGGKRLFAFNSFGLSEVNPVNGALSIIPGLGFNGTLVDPDVADVVLRAFTRHRRSKVISAPRVLVSDNATGVLTSVTEIPFTSVNASQTVATTSFAGFADAGTTIEVTPHISDDSRLQLEYRITLNEFRGEVSSTGVPPPRQTDEIQSVVTIPDGHTLIVGGLHRTSYNHDTDSLPFLEKIPLLRDALALNTENARETSLFIFLRPVILRDDKFRDLKYYSGTDLRRADIRGDAPRSDPVLIK